MIKKWILPVIILASFCLSESQLYASFVPIPQLAPGAAPTVKIIKDKKVRVVNKWKKIENTPALEWEMIKKWKSIEVFQNGTWMVFVQKISLSSGATVGSIFEFHSYDSNTGEPLYERFAPRDELKKYVSIPFSYINGQVFDPKRAQTPFSFGFKLRNTILTAWADNRNENKTIFSYSQSGARMIPYSWESFQAENADFALVNLTLDDSNEDNKYMGRTYICITQPNNLGYSKQILTFSFQVATEPYAQDVMYSWGCEKKNISKLDSSGSSVFGLGNSLYAGYSHKWKPDYRKLPQIITFYDE